GRGERGVLFGRVGEGVRGEGARVPGDEPPAEVEDDGGEPPGYPCVSQRRPPAGGRRRPGGGRHRPGRSGAPGASTWPGGRPAAGRRPPPARRGASSRRRAAWTPCAASYGTDCPAGRQRRSPSSASPAG